MKRQKWIQWLQSTMLLVAPTKYKIHGRIVIPKKVDKDLFYDVLCSSACLNPQSKDVKEAFDNIVDVMMI